MQALIDVIRAVFERVVAVPMPWRALLVALAGFALLYLEFRVTSLLRRALGRAMPAAGIVDFVAQLLIVVSIVGALLWGSWQTWQVTEPLVMVSPAGRYVRLARVWWQAFSEFARTQDRQPVGPGGTPSPSRLRTPSPTARLNRIGSTVTPTSPSGTESFRRTHVVEEGDTLLKISQEYTVTVEELIDANRATYPSLVTNPERLQPGWELIIPEADNE